MWGVLCQQLLFNLVCIAIVFGLFVLCVSANIVISTYYNSKWTKPLWEWKKFWNGVKKMLSIGLSTAILAVAATVIPVVLAQIGMIDETISTAVTVTAVIMLYIQAIIKYFTEALETIKDVLKNRDILKDLEEHQ